MSTNKMKQFTLAGVILSIGIGIFIFGGSFIVTDILDDNSDLSNNNANPSNGGNSGNNYNWSPHSVVDLMGEMEQREGSISRIIWESGFLKCQDETPEEETDEEIGGEAACDDYVYEPYISFPHGIQTFMAENKGNGMWRVYVKAKEFTGYFDVEASILTAVNENFLTNLNLLNDETTRVNTLSIDSEEWRAIYYEKFMAIHTCYDDGSVVTLKFHFGYPPDYTTVASIIIGTWQSNNGDTLISYPEGFLAGVYEVDLVTATPFEIYIHIWRDIMEEVEIYD